MVMPSVVQTGSRITRFDDGMKRSVFAFVSCAIAGVGSSAVVAKVNNERRSRGIDLSIIREAYPDL
jgi:hypothetical protein